MEMIQAGNSSTNTKRKPRRKIEPSQYYIVVDEPAQIKKAEAQTSMADFSFAKDAPQHDRDFSFSQ